MLTSSALVHYPCKGSKCVSRTITSCITVHSQRHCAVHLDKYLWISYYVQGTVKRRQSYPGLSRVSWPHRGGRCEHGSRENDFHPNWRWRRCPVEQHGSRKNGEASWAGLETAILGEGRGASRCARGHESETQSLGIAECGPDKCVALPRDRLRRWERWLRWEMRPDGESGDRPPKAFCCSFLNRVSPLTVGAERSDV